MKPEPDFVLYCDDGHERKVVQRFRFPDVQGAWVPTMVWGESTSSVNSDDTIRWSDGVQGPVRQHFSLLCTGRLVTDRWCRRTVRVRSQDDLEMAIAAIRLYEDGPVSLREFGAVHDHFARLQRPRGAK